VSIEPEIKYEGFGGGPSVVGGLGPGPPEPPLKSGPVNEMILFIHCSPEVNFRSETFTL